MPKENKDSQTETAQSVEYWKEQDRNTYKEHTKSGGADNESD